MIAKVFYLRGYIEAWGTGTTKMIDLCKENAVPVPKFSERTGGLVVTFKFAEPMGASIKKLAHKVELSTRQEAILTIIKKYGETNIKQIISELNNPPSRTIIKRDLNYLKNNGLIEMKGAARNATWVFK